MNYLFCCRKNEEDPDSAWKAQNKAVDENPMYKFINLANAGKLLDVYLEEGEEALEDLIHKELTPYLYNDGDGHLVTKADFCRWKLKSTEFTAVKDDVYAPEELTDKEALSRYKPTQVEYLEDHYACMDLNKRGGVGETPLHLCMLQDTPALNEICKVLIRVYPKQVLDYYEGEEYYGETALHLAIVYGDFEMVRLLVENGANVNQRATGRFFLPEDQKKGIKQTTSYEGFAYYGEYPLAFAACFGHEEIYDYLIDHGADPNMADTFGNTVLHMLVISNQIGMFGYAVKHHARKADMERVNGQSLTPLTLASKLGRNEIFKEIIELQSYEIWRYSNITCSTYPLAPLDTIGPGGKTNWSSALIYITDGDTDEHLEMLDGGVIKQLLDEKWKTYARILKGTVVVFIGFKHTQKRRFCERLVLAILHLLVLSVAIYTRPESNNELLNSTDTTSIIRYIAEIVVCIDSISNLILQLEEIKSQGIIGFIKNQTSAPAKSIFNVSCILIILCIPLRFTGLYDIEMIFLSLAAPCAWVFLLFFARGIGMFGPFVIMIYKMSSSDMLRFLIIYMVFLTQFSQVSTLCGPFITVFYEMLRGDVYRFTTIYLIFLIDFCIAFFFLFKDIEVNITSFKTIDSTIMQLFQMTLGEFKYDDFSYTRQPILTKAVFFMFAVLVPILLLNMVIAMMGNTYQQIISRSAKEWKRQKAKIIIVLERTFSPKQLLKYQEEYSVELMSTVNEKTRGLMVIKTSRKTKARQRKGAITNWKKLANEIKCLIKEQKKEGVKGVLDLTSRDVSEKVNERRELRMRRSNLNDRDDLNEDVTGGLFSAMTQQLAWEKDIDLTKGQTVIRDTTIKEEDEDAESRMTSRTTLDPDTPPPMSASTGGRNGAAVRISGSGGMDNHGFTAVGKDSSSSESLPMKSFHHDEGGNTSILQHHQHQHLRNRGSKISPETSYIEDESSGSNSSGKNKYKKNNVGSKGHSRPPNARSGSGGSKESKDSGGSSSDEKRRTNLALTGSKSSLNSASSLTSLLHAWDKDPQKQKQQNTNEF